MSAPRVQRDGDRLRVEGDLTFATVTALLGSSAGMIDGSGGSGTPLRLDVSALGRVDSAGLALLLEWMRRARAGGRRLQLLEMPERLQVMLQAAGLQEVFEATAATDATAGNG